MCRNLDEVEAQPKANWEKAYRLKPVLRASPPAPLDARAAVGGTGFSQEDAGVGNGNLAA